MEVQRDRLLVDLENVESFGEKIRLKFISEIENRLTQLYSINIAGLKGLACLAFPLGS